MSEEITLETPFSSFIIEQGIVGIAIGTIVGFGLTNFTKELRTHVLTPFLSFLSTSLKKHTSFSSITSSIPSVIRNPILYMTSSVLELFLLLSFVYLIYYYTILPIFKHDLKKEKVAEKQETEWQEQLLSSVSSINKKFIQPYAM